MDLEKIGKFIAKNEKLNNLTQQELADILGVSDRTIGNWENGRNMPDLSLFKPLCQALDITLNDLMSGEKVREKELEEKFEENIENTIKYSNKKVKRVKKISILVAIIIGLILSTLGVLFAIDVTRMRNNEPVFFSTWGFKYAPPVNIDDVNIEKVIKDYLIKEDEQVNYYEGEKSFASMHIYLINKDIGNKYYVYAWVLQEKYYLEDNNVVRDTSTSIPYKFTLIKNNNEFIVSAYDIPRDGSYYVKDMKQIFPNSVLRDMDSIHTDGTIEKLSLEIQNEVNLYFHK